MRRLGAYLFAFVFFMVTLEGISGPRYPLRFLENKGQANGDILFYADIPGGKIYLKKDQLYFVFVDYGDLVDKHLDEEDSHIPDFDPNSRTAYLTQDTIRGHAYRVRFLDSNNNAKVTPDDIGSEKYNYFVGNDPSRWTSQVRSYGEIIYHELYEGIDLRIYSNGSGLKYDFIISPKADPTSIRLAYEGLDELIKEGGNLFMKTSLGELIEKSPIAFQGAEGVKCEFRLEDDIISFDIQDEYDKTQTLTIDPLLIFSTYSGSAADNWGNTATFDDIGNLYSGGMTNHTRFLGQELGVVDLGEFIVTSNAYQKTYGDIWDVALLKYDSTGSKLLFGTYLGGSRSEVPQSLIVNNKGELLVLGITNSFNFPITSNTYDSDFSGGTTFGLFGGSGVPYSGGSDLFIAKLSGDGSELIASTYFGGTDNDGIINTNIGPNSLVRNYGDNSRGDIIVDSEDNVYFASRTYSRDLLLNGFQPQHGGGGVDGIIVKMTEDLSQMIWGTYYGGSGEDAALSIKLTPQNDVYIAGGTTSLDFPTTPNSLHPLPTGITDADGYVARISSDGSQLLAATFIGTVDYDQVYQMDLDGNGDVYVVGQTRGPYPITEGPRVDPNSGQFVHKLTAELDSTLFSTVFGSGRGEPDIYITAFLVNDCNNLYISGWGSPFLVSRGFDYMQMNTSGLQTTAEAHQLTSDGSSFYLAVYTDDMSELLYATHLGSSSSVVHVDGGTSRFDKQGIVYHAVCASCNVDDSTFPTTPGAWSEENGSRGCNNAAFKFDLASLNARIRTNSADLVNPNIVNGCAPFEVAFENISVGGEIFEWKFGDDYDTISYVRDTIYHTFEDPGTYEIELKAIDSSTCAEEDFAYATINVYATNFQVSSSTEICGGDFAQLSASGGVQYQWEPAATLIQSNSPFPKAKPDTTTMYYLTMVDQNGCVHEDSLLVEVIPEIKLDIQVAQRDKCNEVPNLEFINKSENFETIFWDFGNGESSSEFEPKALYEEPGNYDVTVLLTNQYCTKEFKIPVVLDDLFIPNVITPNGDGENDVFKITSALPIKLSIFNRYGKEVFQSDNYQNDWDGTGMKPGIYYYEVTFPDLEICSGWVHLLF